MYGLGTIINVAAIIVGGLLGFLFGKFLKAQHQDSLIKVCGISVLFIGTTGALEGMLTVSDGAVTSGGALLVIGCLGATVLTLMDMYRDIVLLVTTVLPLVWCIPCMLSARKNMRYEQDQESENDNRN